MKEKATFIMIIGNGACKIDGAASAKKYLSSNRGCAIYHFTEEGPQQIECIEQTLEILKLHFRDIKKSVKILKGKEAEEVYSFEPETEGMYLNVTVNGMKHNIHV